MLSVNSMLNQDHQHQQHQHYISNHHHQENKKQPVKTEPSSTSSVPLRPTVLNISHLLCDPPMKSPSLSPSSSPSPTDSFLFPFAQEVNTPTTSPFSSTTSLHYTNHSDFALHSRPYLPTEDNKRRSPSLPADQEHTATTTTTTTTTTKHHPITSPASTVSSSSICEEEDQEEEDELDDDQLSINSKTSSLSSSTTARLKAKRRRANAKQLQILNQVFDRTFFPSTQMRAELGRQLGMSPRTVQIWFQNKRQAMRTRERQRLLTLKDGSD